MQFCQLGFNFLLVEFTSSTCSSFHFYVTTTREVLDMSEIRTLFPVISSRRIHFRRAFNLYCLFYEKTWSYVFLSDADFRCLHLKGQIIKLNKDFLQWAAYNETSLMSISLQSHRWTEDGPSTGKCMPCNVCYSVCLQIYGGCFWIMSVSDKMYWLAGQEIVWVGFKAQIVGEVEDHGKRHSL